MLGIRCVGRLRQEVYGYGGLACLIKPCFGNGCGGLDVKPIVYGVRLNLPSMERLVEAGALELIEVRKGVECGRILEKAERVSLDVLYVVGEGLRIRFWYDLWCGHVPLKDLYLDLFSRALGKDAWISELITITSDGGSRSWNIKFQWAPDDWEVESVDAFYEHIYSKIPRVRGLIVCFGS